MGIVAFVLLLLLICIISAIIYANNNMKKKWEEATNTDVRLVREAVEYSQRASNTTNAMLALVEATNARRTMEVLVRRYGRQRADEITGQDTGAVLDTLTRQQDRIMMDLTENHPEIVPRGELKSYRGFVADRDGSRDDDVPHMESYGVTDK